MRSQRLEVHTLYSFYPKCYSNVFLRNVINLATQYNTPQEHIIVTTVQTLMS